MDCPDAFSVNSIFFIDFLPLKFAILNERLGLKRFLYAKFDLDIVNTGKLTLSTP